MKKKTFQEKKAEQKKVAEELQIPESFVIHMHDVLYVLVKGQVLFALRMGMKSLITEILEHDHQTGFYLMQATLHREDGGIFVAHATGCGSIMKGGHRMAHAETRAISRVIRISYPLHYVSPEEHDLTNEMLNKNPAKDPTTETACTDSIVQLIDLMDSKTICSTTLQTVCRQVFNKSTLAELSTGQLQALVKKFKEGPSKEDRDFENKLLVDNMSEPEAVDLFKENAAQTGKRAPWKAVYLQRYINRL